MFLTYHEPLALIKEFVFGFLNVYNKYVRYFLGNNRNIIHVNFCLMNDNVLTENKNATHSRTILILTCVVLMYWVWALLIYSLLWNLYMYQSVYVIIYCNPHILLVHLILSKLKHIFMVFQFSIMKFNQFTVIFRKEERLVSYISVNTKRNFEIKLLVI